MMATLPKLPMLVPCSHYRYEGTSYGCAVRGECKPIQAGADVSECPDFHNPRIAQAAAVRAAKPHLSIDQLAARRKNCREAKARGEPCTEFSPQAKFSPQHQRGAILIPRPPAILLTPLHPRAVVTVCVGEESERCLAVAEPYMRLYASRVGADFVKLMWPGHPRWGLSSKFAIGKVLDHYERIAYVDADILLRPGCVDLFQACAADEFGAVDQLPHHTSSMGSYAEDYQRMRALLGYAQSPLPWYFNAGVMVASKDHAGYFLPPKIPMPIYHCAEQDHTNAVVLDAVQAGLVKLRLLDRRCNWQNWQDQGFKTAPPDAILHWSGSGQANRDRRASEMKEWAARYPLPLPSTRDWSPPAALFPENAHRYYADLRHVQMLHAELMTGKHRRVLEIGSFHGYSTCAFLDAAAQGKVAEVHLCDLMMREELRRTVAHYNLGERVVLHQQPSADLLAVDTDWDLVFVDGDHSVAIVDRETAALLRATIPTVFAHDTAEAAHTRYGVALGPRRLAAAFRADGRYACSEDAQLRASERTERGLFLARLKRPAPRPSCTFSIIIATSGRPSITRTLASITPQLLPGDEVIIERDNTNDMAATPRTRGMLAATGDYLLFMDDDDIYTANALATVRKALAENPGRPHLFGMSGTGGWTLPQHGQDVRGGNVSTQMIVLPNEPAKFGAWGPRRRGDFDFIQATLLLWNEPPIWRKEIIAVWRPN